MLSCRDALRRVLWRPLYYEKDLHREAKAKACPPGRGEARPYQGAAKRVSTQEPHAEIFRLSVWAVFSYSLMDPLDDLFEFLRFPSISANSQFKSHVEACADWLK
jgi:hypothetical protein